MNRLQSAFNTSISIREEMLQNGPFVNQFERAVTLLVNTFQSDGKVLLCGNGGSAADAQHIAAELSGRFQKDRKPLFAEALHVNGSYLTAVANDYGYEEVFARMCQAMGKKGDVLVGISTSGNSKNVVKAMKQARSIGMQTIAMLGSETGEMASMADVVLHVPSTNTARIQEVHITLGHVICEELEAQLFPND